MTLKSLVQYGFAIAILCTSVFALEHKHHIQSLTKKTSKPNDDNMPVVELKQPFTIESKKEVVIAIKPDMGPIEEQEKKFTFDWNQQLTIEANKNKIAEQEKFISEINNVSKLSKEDQLALGRLFYKLGTYYTHVARQPHVAINKLTIANAFLTEREAKAWTYNHLAYAYEQKYAGTNNSNDKEKALYYANTVISELLPRTKGKPIAFAYSVKGLIETQSQDYKEAEKNLKTALAFYEALPNSKDDQYARTKNRLANALLGQTGRENEAISLIKEVKKYWASKGNLKQDPYAARCMISLGQAYLKTGQAKEACTELKTAIDIYRNVYGKNSILLVKPYQLLAQAYKTLGQKSQASAYEKKANELSA